MFQRCDKRIFAELTPLHNRSFWLECTKRGYSKNTGRRFEILLQGSSKLNSPIANMQIPCQEKVQEGGSNAYVVHGKVYVWHRGYPVIVHST